MAANTIDAIVSRVDDVLQSEDIGLTRAVTPFTFDKQPSQQADGVYRIETEGGNTIAGFNYIEDRTDLLIIWVARKLAQDPNAAVSQLRQDAATIRAAIIRDGLDNGGDYHVPDSGGGFSLPPHAGVEFAVLRLTVPVGYEAQV